MHGTYIRRVLDSTGIFTALSPPPPRERSSVERPRPFLYNYHTRFPQLQVRTHMWFPLSLLLGALSVVASMSAESDPSLNSAALPVTSIPAISTEADSGSYWLGKIKHRGSAPYSNSPSTYKVYRNVKDYGAKGDGISDDTAVCPTDPASVLSWISAHLSP